jgi:hypothetical protein
MMKCREVRRRLSAYLDGELPQEARDCLFDHLTECGPCSNLLGEMMFTETLVGTLIKRPMQAPAAIRHNVLSAISRQQAPAPVSPLWSRLAWRPAAAFAGAMALAVAGLRTLYVPTAPVVSQPVTVASVPAPAPVAAPRPASPAPEVGPATVARHAPQPRPRVATVAPEPRRAAPAASRPEPASTPTAPAVRPTETLAVGIVTLVTGSIQERAGDGTWADFTTDTPVKVASRFRSAENTVVTMEFLDGTVLKSNASTEFVVLRSPSRDDSRWVVRLVRGELLVRTSTGVRIETGAANVDSAQGEFSVRSMGGDDAAVVAVSGEVRVANRQGAVTLRADEGTSASDSAAPGEPFYVDVAGATEWANRPAEPFDPLDTGGTQS